MSNISSASDYSPEKVFQMQILSDVLKDKIYDIHPAGRRYFHIRMSYIFIKSIANALKCIDVIPTIEDSHIRGLLVKMGIYN